MLLYFLNRSTKKVLPKTLLSYSVVDQLHNLIRSKKKLPERGLFGYYSLADWWETNFNETEKHRFKDAFENNPLPISFDYLFDGKERPLMEEKNKPKSAVGFLSILLNTLATTKGCEEICQKFINKCKQLINSKTKDQDLYCFYLSQIKLYGRLKQDNPFYEMPFRSACENQVDIL